MKQKDKTKVINAGQ